MTSILLILTFLASAADTPATTEDGHSVVLHDDHTWSEVEAAPTTPPGAPKPPVAPKSCDDLIATTTDKMTGKSTTSAKEPIIISDDSKTGLIMSLFTGSNSTIWGVTAIGASSCIDDDDKALILFVDGSRMELENDSKFNCDGRFTQYFGGSFGKKTEQKTLGEREIDTMRVWTRDGFVERTLTVEQRSVLRQTFACLSQ